MKTFALCLILAFGIPVALFADAPTSGLVAYYTFSGNALDSSGHGHDGTLYGPTLTTDRFGNANSAYSFDGASYINIPSATDFDWYPGVGITLSIWAYLPYYVYPEHLMGRRNGDPFWQVAIGVGALQPAEVPLNQWVQIVLVLGDNYQGNYVNGVLSHTDTFPFNTPITGNIDVQIGTSGFYEPFVGGLDDVRVYNRQLSSEEIQNLYLAEVPEPGSLALLTSGVAAWLVMRARRPGRTKAVRVRSGKYRMRTF